MVTFSPAVLALPPNHDGQIPLPPELVENIIDCFSDDPQMLVTCSLVSKEWSIRSRCHLFNLVDLNRETAERWRSIITPGPNGASCLVRTLTLRQSSIFPWLETKPLDAFSDHFSSFQNVERLFITWLDLSRFEPGSLARHFAHYGPSLRSLHLTYLRADYSTLITFLQLFPNLEELLIHIPRLFDDRPPPLTSRPATNTRGTLNLSSFGLDSSPFVPHLTGFDLRFSSISLYQCDFSSGSSLSDLLEASASSLRHLELKHITFCESFFFEISSPAFIRPPLSQTYKHILRAVREPSRHHNWGVRRRRKTATPLRPLIHPVLFSPHPHHDPLYRYAKPSLAGVEDS